MELLVFLYTCTTSIISADGYVDPPQYDGWGFTLDVQPDDPIHKIKSRIHDITDILPREQHRWMFACGDDVAPLNDDLLCDYQISDAGS